MAYRPWLPGSSSTDIIAAAWPVNPLYNATVGELLAISECLAIACRQICQSAQFCSPIAQPVVVRIFSDSQHSLAHFQGLAPLRHDINLLAKPVLDHIALQSAVLHQLGANVHLELHWIPGHGHPVQPHAMADTYARFARVHETAYSTITGNHWQLLEEPPVAGYLHQQLADAASEVAVYMSGLGDRPSPVVNGLAPTPRARPKQTRKTTGGNQYKTRVAGTLTAKAKTVFDRQINSQKADKCNKVKIENKETNAST